MISIVVPIYNEQENIPILYDQLIKVMGEVGQTFEFIFINDGSSDKSPEILNSISEKDDRAKVLHFGRNFGQTAAFMAGFDFAQGEIIIPIDADLQNDPEDIPHLIEKLEEGYDVVSGWRKDRKDASIKRNFVSRVANKLISFLSGVNLHDYGCTLKAYRSELIKSVHLYGEMHRFIPIFVSWHGGRVTEIPVKHHERVHGKSKYGLERIFKVILDLLVMQFLSRYNTKPIYVFGGVGIFSIFISFLTFIYAVYLKLFGSIDFVQTPLLLLVTLTFIMGAMSILMGFIAEMLVRIYYEAPEKTSYYIKETRNVNSKS
jgi:glycosyltransferase involved in cell wall biosynthesis